MSRSLSQQAASNAQRSPSSHSTATRTQRAATKAESAASRAQRAASMAREAASQAQHMAEEMRAHDREWVQQKIREQAEQQVTFDRNLSTTLQRMWPRYFRDLLLAGLARISIVAIISASAYIVLRSKSAGDLSHGLLEILCLLPPLFYSLIELREIISEVSKAQTVFHALRQSQDPEVAGSHAATWRA